MSSARIPERLGGYLAERSEGDDVFLQALKRDAKAAGMPEIWIGEHQAATMAVLLKLIGAKEVVEVGTLAGYSAIRMARALPADGNVRTIEIDGAFADFAEHQVMNSDVPSRVQVLRGDAVDVLPAIEADSVDAVFLDADKEGYSTYVGEAARILRRNGLLMVDNAFAFGRLFDEECDEAGVLAVRRVNDELARSEDFEGVLVPVGDGMWVARRR